MPRIDLDDYEVGERIGAGTVGTIFRVTHKQSGEVRAMKLLSPAVSSNELIVSRFAREMLILEKLDHPNILAYYGGGKQDDQLFFVMELITGGTLKELLAEGGALEWREAAESVRQISAALQHAHNHAIIHRDLKPGNIFVTEEGELKLGDFGIARDTREQDLTEAGLTVGTYYYMAPELVRGDRGITGQVDLYALGCVLFELLTGNPPFVGDNFPQIFDQHLKAKPPKLAECGVAAPVEIQELLDQLLEKQPENRPFNARWVQGYLGDLLDNSKFSATANDRAAGEVTVAKQMIADRVHKRRSILNTAEVSWATLGWIIAALLAAILFAVLFGDN